MTCLRRIPEARHVFPRPLKSSHQSENPPQQVYRIMALTTGTFACGQVGTAYWGRLRKQIV